MKKLLVLCVMLMMYVVCFCETVTLINETRLEGQIVGKQGDQLFLKVNDNTYLLNKSDIIKIKKGLRSIKSLTFEKKDWGVSSGTAFQMKETISEISNKPIDQMTEREYQLYLAQIQAKAVKDGARKVNRTIWKVFLVNMAISAVGVLVISASSK